MCVCVWLCNQFPDNYYSPNQYLLKLKASRPYLGCDCSSLTLTYFQCHHRWSSWIVIFGLWIIIMQPIDISLSKWIGFNMYPNHILDRIVAISDLHALLHSHGRPYWMWISSSGLTWNQLRIVFFKIDRLIHFDIFNSTVHQWWPIFNVTSCYLRILISVSGLVLKQEIWEIHNLLSPSRVCEMLVMQCKRR